MPSKDSFQDKLDKTTDEVRVLFEELKQSIESEINVKGYPTKVSDYRFKHPRHHDVFIEIIPMRREPALQVNIRVDNEILPPCSIKINDIGSNGMSSGIDGPKWIQLSLKGRGDLAEALSIIMSLSK